MNSIGLVLSHCGDSRTLEIVTPMLEVYSITYCPEGTHSVMKATSKTILFGTVTHERKVQLWPVAVFANDGEARSYATFLRLAYRAKDDESIAALDPSYAKDVEGKPLYGTKWSIKTVPYSPMPELDSDESSVKDETPST